VSFDDALHDHVCVNLKILCKVMIQPGLRCTVDYGWGGLETNFGDGDQAKLDTHMEVIALVVVDLVVVDCDIGATIVENLLIG